MKSCTRCTLNEAADTITFRASDGVCSVCQQHEVKHTGIDWAQRRKDLDTIADTVRGTGTYDLVLPFSGAKDSTFQLWFVITQLKLRPLVCRVNHHMYRPQIARNIQRCQEKLGFDMVEFTPNWRVWRELMVESLKRRGDNCYPCHVSIYSYPMKVALQHGIKLICWGEALNEYQSWGTGWDEDVGEVRFNRAMNMGITSDDMFQFLDGRVERRELEPFAYPSSEELRKLGVRSLCLGSYIKWNARENTEIIKRELGWEGAVVEGTAPGYTWDKTECQNQGTRDWLRFIKRGQGRASHHANIDIRDGLITREQGLEMAAANDGKEPASLGFILNKMGVSRDEFYEIANSHAVDPWEGIAGIKFETGPALPDIDSWR